MPTSTKHSFKCGQCRHYDQQTEIGEGYCRRNPPVAGHGWPILRDVDWCGEYAPAVYSGRNQKLTDEEVVKIVRESTAPLGEGKPEQAMQRSALVVELEEMGMAKTPAYKRIEGLVKRGMLEMGVNPPIEKVGNKNMVYVWMPREEKVAKGTGRPLWNTEDEFLAQIKELGCVTEKEGRRLRKLAVECRLSLSTGQRLMAKLVEQKKVVKGPRGYYACDTEELP